MVPAPMLTPGAHGGVAQVGEVLRLRALAQVRLLELDEVAHLRPLADAALRAQVGEGADARPGLDHRLAQQAVVEDLGARADLDVDEAHEGAHDGARAHDRATLEDRERPQHGPRLDDDVGAHERARRVLDAHALRREMLRPAHESVGATSAWNSAPARSGSKSSSRRAWARLAGLAWMADLSALSAAGASPARACAAARQ